MGAKLTPVTDTRFGIGLMLGSLALLSSARADEIEEIPVDSRAIHSGPIVPRGVPVVPEEAYARYLPTVVGGTVNPGKPGHQKMYDTYYKDFKGYFDKLPKKAQIPMEQLKRMVAEIRAESASGNHRFMLDEVRDGCFLRNMLCKAKLAENGFDITQSTASLISRHGWDRDRTGTRNTESRRQIAELDQKNDSLNDQLQLANRGLKDIGLAWKKEEKIRKDALKLKIKEIESQIAANERQMSALEVQLRGSATGSGAEVAPADDQLRRWTFHSVCLINTDQGPYVFDPDVKGKTARFNGDLLTPLAEWMKFDWNNADPHFTLAPYNYTDVYQFRDVPKPPEGHGYTDKEFGHVFGKLPDDPIWATNPRPPQILARAEGRTPPYQPNSPVIEHNIAGMQVQALRSADKYGVRKCRSEKSPGTERVECLRENHRRTCDAIYAYETQGEPQASEIQLSAAKRTRCYAQAAEITK